MKLTSFLLTRAAACACAALMAGVSAGAAGLARRTDPAGAPQEGSAQAKEKAKGPQVSEGERKAAAKIESAPDAAAKLQAAGEFVKKYPKSELRSQVSSYVLGQLYSLPDPAQRITLAESFRAQFNEPGEINQAVPLLVDAYIAAKRIDDAFRVGAPWLAQNPEEAGVLTVLALYGTDEVKRNNPKYMQQSIEYGVKAIELIEADKKPAGMTDEQWSKNKASWLPQLYQSMGILAMVSGKTDDALSRLQTATAHNPSDPFNYYLIGNIKNDAYQQLAKQYQGLPPGRTQDEMLKKINAQLDEVIDLYARTVALASGRAEFKQLHDAVLQDLQSYYKFRHNNSTEGLQKLIDKHKAPPQ